MKLFRSLKVSYDATLVLLIVGVAVVLLYALYRAVGGAGAGAKLSFAASFDDVTGIKEKSKVLFKGMPVGSVGGLMYEPKTDKILVRIDLTSTVEIPSHVQPFLESSLFGESHITLRTNPDDPSTATLASVVNNSFSIEKLHRIDGVRLSKADSILPGLDESAMKAVTAAERAMEEVKLMAIFSKNMLKTVNDDMDKLVLNPVHETMEELKKLIAGPEGQADAGLAADLKQTVDDLARSSEAIRVLFAGDPATNKKGLADMTQNIEGGWQQIMSTLLEGKEEALAELHKVSAALDRAGDAISRSEGQIKKLGNASDRVGDAAKRVDVFMEMLALKPNAVVWGKSDAQKRMIDQRGGTTPAPAPARRQPPVIPRK